MRSSPNLDFLFTSVPTSFHKEYMIVWHLIEEKRHLSNEYNVVDACDLYVCRISVLVVYDVNPLNIRRF